ncbi:MAG: hypothetical protein ACOH1O_03470 [Flavobacterium sp.]
MIVNLSKFGPSLSSRLKGREIFSEIKSEMILSEKIILNFDKIEIMTLSFGTELFDSINQHSNCEIEIINSNNFVGGVIGFCRSNLKQTYC